MPNFRRLATCVVIVSSCSLGLQASLTPATAVAPANTRLKVDGTRWFTSGTNLPYYRYRCDFGCRGNGGVVGNKAPISRQFDQLQGSGIKVVRWYAFSGDAWQIRRGADGTPTALRPAIYADFDEAVRLAEQFDLYLTFVLFPDPTEIPATWISDAAQREQLARTLAPLFARYHGSKHVLAWEIFNEPERGIDAGTIDTAAAQATVQRLTLAVHAASSAKATVGSVSVDRAQLWKGLGLDFFAPHWFSPTMASGPSCALCTSFTALDAQYGLGAPVVLGAVDMPTTSAASLHLRQSYNRGFAGIWSWSARPVAHPSLGGATSRIDRTAPWRFIYANNDVGPRARVLNPCLGPNAATLRCPDLAMSPPSSMFTARRGGRTLLLSRNSLNNIGTGAASLYGTRNGRLTMTAVQKITRVRGGKLTVDTDAKLRFKAIPGQYRYWKWNGAATFELWRLDGAGTPVQRVRRGPKTVYCLRDLRRTRGYLARSPRGEFFPACSQNLNQRNVTLGTSVGWSDIYPATYYENWIDVSSLKGCFAFVHVADPENQMYESNERNNTSKVTIRLPFRGGAAGCPKARPFTTGSGETGY